MSGSPVSSPGTGGRQPTRGQVSGIPGQVEALGNQEGGIRRHQEHPKAWEMLGGIPKRKKH